MGHEQEEGGKWPYAGTAEAIKALGAKHCVKGVTISFLVAGVPEVAWGTSDTLFWPFRVPWQGPCPQELYLLALSWMSLARRASLMPCGSRTALHGQGGSPAELLSERP